jgi:hypothetical protein
VHCAHNDCCKESIKLLKDITEVIKKCTDTTTQVEPLSEDTIQKTRVEAQRDRQHLWVADNPLLLGYKLWELAVSAGISAW